MRINDLKYSFYSYQNQQNRSTITNSQKKSSNATDDVEISSLGREISQTKMTEQAGRQKRVQELKQQIESGTYHVDSNKIADKMLEFWKSNSN